MIQNGIVGYNVNQNHSQGGRISTRVLAPPGGGSTFSIGGYGGGTEAPKKRNSYAAPAAPPAASSYNNYDGGSKSSYKSYSADSNDDNKYSRQQIQKPAVNARDIRREAVDEARSYRDSLDDAVDYSYTNAAKEKYASSSVQQSAALSNSRGFGPRSNGPISKNDYAEMLRMQIASNKGKDTGSKIGSTYQERPRERENSGYSYNRHAAAPGMGQRPMPKAARTSFSLNWE